MEVRMRRWIAKKLVWMKEILLNRLKDEKLKQFKDEKILKEYLHKNGTSFQMGNE